MSRVGCEHDRRVRLGERSGRTSRGSGLVAVVAALVLLEVLVAAALVGGSREQNLGASRLDATRALYAAEAGMNMAVREVRLEADSDGDGLAGSVSSNSVSSDDPMVSGASVYVTSATSGPVTTLTARARIAGGTVLRRVVATHQPSVAMQTFTGAGIGSTYTTFAQLQSGFQVFASGMTGRIGFETLSIGTQLGSQFTASDGVTFTNANTNIFGVRAEGDANLEPMDGYDGTYRPDADRAYVRASNFYSSTPFTVVFTNPVGRMACFLGMGKEGSDGTLTVKVYDSSDAILANLTVTTTAWANAFNREGFFAVKSPSANIKKVSIQNNSTVNYANALIFDELLWSFTPLPHTPPDVRSWAEASATGP